MKRDNNGNLVTCDFCNESLEEDEELHPIFIGKPPKAKPVRIEQSQKKMEKNIGYRSQSKHGFEHGMNNESMVILGRPADEISAILKGLEGHPKVRIDSGRQVVTPSFEMDDRSDQFNEEVVGINITIEPNQRIPSPDLEVCPVCEEGLKEEGK